MKNWIIPLVVVVCSVPFLVAMRATGSRQLAAAYARRRPRQAALVAAGIVVACAMFVSAVVVGDSLRASIRRTTLGQLGPVDEEVMQPGVDAAGIAAAIARAPGGASVQTLPMVAAVATVRGRDFVARVSQAQVLETDFVAAQRFAGGPQRSGLAGNPPAAGEAAITADLSDAIAITSGHRVTVYAFGSARTFTITSVLPRRGIATLRTPLSPAPSAAYNIFVPVGTISAMRGASTGAGVRGQAAPEAIVAVAHADTARSAAAVADGAHATGADVRPIRRQLLADAARRSRTVTDLFRSLALLGALAGVALLVLALASLARQRVRATAVLRAHGLSRGGVVIAIALEGWIYALAGTVVGAACGWGLARLVVLGARHVFANGNSTNVDLVFSVRAATFVNAAATVLLVALAAIAMGAVVTARRNVVAALRNAQQSVTMRSTVRRAIGTSLFAGGVVLTVLGVAATIGEAAVMGPVVVAAGVVVLNRLPPRRSLVAGLAVAVLVWSLVVVQVVPRAWSAIGGGLIVTEGIVMTAAFVALLATVLRAARLGASAHRLRAYTLGSVYARQPSWRTVLVAATYATLLFMLTVLVTVRGLYERDTAQLAHRLGGGNALEVSSNPSNPVPPEDVAHLEGVVAVMPAATASAQIATAGAASERDITVVGIDASWIGSASPPTVEANARAVYDRVVHDPTRVLVGADLYADRESGFPGGLPRVGDRIQLRVPTTGAVRNLTIGGVVAAARYDGQDHVYIARNVLDAMLASPAATNLLFVQTRPGTNANVLAAVIDGTHLENGTYARSFVRLAEESTASRTQFLDISAGYAAVGLVAAIVAVAIVMIDRVRERRRQVAALRAFGVPLGVLRRSVRIETGLIALAGALGGVGCGVLLTWRFDRVDAFTAARGVHVPIFPLAVGLLAVVVVSIAAGASAARSAARLRPAPVLRANE